MSMDSFFSGMSMDQALDLTNVSRRSFDVREQRKQLLANAGVDDADVLLAAVREGRVDAVAGYDVWLAQALLQEQYEALRAWVDWRSRDNGKTPEPSITPMADLLNAQPLPEPFASQLMLHPDAVSLTDDNLSLIARIVSATQWSLQWSIGERTWRLDTAPRADSNIATRACLRRPDGSITADPWNFDAITTRAAVLPHLLEKLAITPEP